MDGISYLHDPDADHSVVPEPWEFEPEMPDVGDATGFADGAYTFGNVYEGIVHGAFDKEVTVNGEPLPLFRNVVNHSTEFNWGYGGSGPAQLALAILCKEYGKQFALERYQAFKWSVIAWLSPSLSWKLDSGTLAKMVKAHPDTRWRYTGSEWKEVK